MPLVGTSCHGSPRSDLPQAPETTAHKKRDTKKNKQPAVLGGNSSARHRPEWNGLPPRRLELVSVVYTTARARFIACMPCGFSPVSQFPAIVAGFWAPIGITFPPGLVSTIARSADGPLHGLLILFSGGLVGDP